MKKIVCLILAIVCLFSLASCSLINKPSTNPPENEPETPPVEETHQCEDACETCGKCTDAECTETECAEKCQGHEPISATYDFKVMSFNLDQAYGNDSTKQAKILNKILSEIPDVLGVQEETTGWAKFLEGALESEGYVRVGEFRSTQPSHAYYGFREASSIYYNVDRFELVDSGTFWLSTTPDVEGSVATGWHSSALFPRVCTWVILKDKVSGLEFAYFNSHFSYEHETLRNESAKLIMSKIEEAGVPAFFSGDLNFASNEETDTYEVITNVMEDSRTSAPDTMSGNTFHNYGYEAGESYGDGKCKTVPIDYIFSTKGDFDAVSFKILSETGDKGDPSDYYSDHFAIVANYQLTVVYER